MKKKMEYVIARGSNSGVHAGLLVSRNGSEVELKDARRIWYWKGAATLSELAERGTRCPAECKFPIAVSKVVKTDVCEVLSVSAKARKSIESVPVWSNGE